MPVQFVPTIALHVMREDALPACQATTFVRQLQSYVLVNALRDTISLRIRVGANCANILA